MENTTSVLIDLYHTLYGQKIRMTHLDELATDLSQIAGRTRPWTGKYLHSLIKGYPGFNANGQFREALTVLASQLEECEQLETQAQQTTVKTIHELPPETVILGQAKRCATSGCNILFVPTHPRQKYHSKACAKIGQRQRRQNKRKRNND